MPRQYQPVEYNTFVGGLVTEASPLTFPQNASLDEENFVLNKDGSRSRRLGMGFEAGYQIVNSEQSLVDGSLVTSSFKWSNAGGLSTNTIICVQIGSSIDFFQGNASPISPTKFFTYTFDDLDDVVKFSYAVVDGKLVVASGSKDIHVFTYHTTRAPATAISVETKRLLVRDLFGLDAIDAAGHDLRQGNEISLRPKIAQTPGAHIYNLRNQGWAVPRSPWQGDDHIRDTIIAFRNQDDQGRYPSNADNVTAFIAANTDNHGGTKTIMRFDVENMVVQPPMNTYSPIGYFIIDALDRGESRIKAIQDMQSKYPMNDGDLANAAITGVRTDSTPSGATCICEYAGRVWYAGFSGEVIAGDSHSPKMNSYILFSQLVTDSSGINLCYQSADPTDPDNSDLVDTDGGFLRIEGAYGIVGMAVLQSTLFILAQNGVWTVSGGSGGGFTATNYQTSMLTSAGCMSAGSIVVMQDSIFYWGLDGIYSITRNEFGDFLSKNITDKTIKSFYMSIPNKSIQNAEGVYDSYDTAVKWVFNNYIGAPDDVIELNLDVVTGAYYKHRIKPLQGGFPLLIRGIQTDPYRVETNETDVVVGADDVVVTNGSQVVTSGDSLVSGVKEMVYFILTGVN